MITFAAEEIPDSPSTSMKSCTRIDSVMRRPVAVLPITVIIFAASVFMMTLSPIERVSVELVFAIPDGLVPVV